MHKEIGGYFELELPGRAEYHPQAVALNSGRNCLRQIVRNRQIKSLWLPIYTSQSLLDVLRAEGVQVHSYSIAQDFSPILSGPVEDPLLYINYFGVNSKNVEAVVRAHPGVIIDNAQAFFSRRIPGIDTFYSPRKFFGVPDGGYLYCDAGEEAAGLDTSTSSDHSSHLLTRIDLSARAGYEDFKRAEAGLKGEPIRKMSRLTRRLLQSIEYNNARARRLENFETLHQALGRDNELSLQRTEEDVPMVYPFLTRDPALRKVLIEQSIYVATYWPGSEDRLPAGSWEARLTSTLIPLPIDQRYGREDMDRVIDVVRQNL